MGGGGRRRISTNVENSRSGSPDAAGRPRASGFIRIFRWAGETAAIGRWFAETSSAQRGITANAYPTATSLSDVAEMNTVTWGPESPPTFPHIAHESLRSWIDHHVERGTKIVTRSAR